MPSAPAPRPLLNEEGAFDGDVVEAQLAHETDEKKRWRRDEVVRRQLAKSDKNKIRGIYNRAAYWSERVRLMQHWANRLDRPAQGSCRAAARIGLKHSP
jgi:hypothetical protein